MKLKLVKTLLVCVPFAVAACSGDDGAQGPAGDTGPAGPQGPAGMDGTNGTNGTDGTDGMAGANAGDFSFRTEMPGDYTRVDRMGFNAVATAVISSKDAYNQGSPAQDADAANPFVAEIVASVDAYHAVLDDELSGLNLDPCSTGAAGECVSQAAPLVLPDDVNVDRSSPAGFPNGRLLSDPSVDVTLAAILLDVTTPGTCGSGSCALTTLVGTSQDANDVEFLPFFPYVAPPF